jgi:hypothetical protein
MALVRVDRSDGLAVEVDRNARRGSMEYPTQILRDKRRASEANSKVLGSSEK